MSGADTYNEQQAAIFDQWVEGQTRYPSDRAPLAEALYYRLILDTGYPDQLKSEETMIKRTIAGLVSRLSPATQAQWSAGLGLIPTFAQWRGPR